MKQDEYRAAFLPVTKQDMENRGWEQLDIVMISADAYVDHPSFGVPLLARLLESKGYKVGIIAQPDWQDDKAFLKLGVPRLCCMIGTGNIDSMVLKYTSANKPRSEDFYAPGGKSGFRPDRVAPVYVSKARQAFGKEVPIIIGGLEASLRRFAHYDFWSDRIRNSVLLDAKADMLIYGMGEKQTLEIVRRLQEGQKVEELTDIKGTCVSFSEKHKEEILKNSVWPLVMLPSFEEVAGRDKKSNRPTEEGKRAYAEAFQMQLEHENPLKSTRILQQSGNRYVLQNPPADRLTTKEFDSLYELPYTRMAHPDYDKDGGVPALREVQFSITSNRGCFGGCSFCAITSHQGRMIQIRSKESLVREATSLTKLNGFKGYIHDLGGPTANFQGLACMKQSKAGPCDQRQCLFPSPCLNLQDTHRHYLEILEAVEAVPGVKKVFIRSGIRFDYLMEVCSPEIREQFIDHMVTHNVSGQLKVAPEHIDPQVLAVMGKPRVGAYEAFEEAFHQANHKHGLKQYLIPYFIAAHPGSTLQSALKLALYLKKVGFVPDQCQEFYPTPGTVSTCMYYTGLDPRPGMDFAPVYVPKGRERTLQRALLQFNKPGNAKLVKEALQLCDRMDLYHVLCRR
jgi:uncharacterized radical SAM protein YgiQ